MPTMVDDALHAPTKIPKKIEMVKEDAAPPPQVASVVGMAGMAGGSGNGVPGGLFGGTGTGSGPVVKAAPPPKPKGPLRISGGVVSGNKLSGQNPTYPPIAKAAHVSGAVVIHAIISKSGSVEQAEVVSGPEMLRSAALEAIRTWRYKPYLLNGDPTEVDTTITVNFNFGG
jgi:protein TonB